MTPTGGRPNGSPPRSVSCGFMNDVRVCATCKSVIRHRDAVTVMPVTGRIQLKRTARGREIRVAVVG